MMDKLKEVLNHSSTLYKSRLSIHKPALRVRYSRLLPLVALLCLLLYYISSTFTAAPAPGGVRTLLQDDQHLLGELPGVRHINPHLYRYIINEPKPCGNVFLLVLVASAPNNVDRRDAIRATWGALNVRLYRNMNVKVVFLFGAAPNKRAQKQLQHESVRYRDVIQEDFVDSYHNLTLKTIMGLKWTSKYCRDSKFVMKTDDDIFVNIPNLVSYLAEKRFSRTIVGCNKQLTAPKPIHPKGIIPPPAHPPFVAGAGYVISGDIVRELYLASLDVPFIPVEDVYVTGHCAARVGVAPPKHVQGFSCGEAVRDECELVTKFTGHRVVPEKMYSIWEKFTSDPNPCMDF